MLKWMKDVENQYFEYDENEEKWSEYQNGELFATFFEIDRSGDNNSKELEVLILKNDGLILKLTPESAFWGNERNQIDKFLCNGRWKKENLTKVTNVSDNNTLDEENVSNVRVVDDNTYNNTHAKNGKSIFRFILIIISTRYIK